MRDATDASIVLALVRSFLKLERSKGLDAQALLFGSWAYGEPTRDSDIDVALILERQVDEEIERGIWMDAHAIDPRIEPHIFVRDDFKKARKAVVIDIKERGIPVPV